MADCTCEGWEAIHDHEPPGPARLRVTATCTCPRDGYKLRLERHEPQGSNPKDLLLRLVEDAPDFGVDRMTPEPVRYDEETDVEYDTVSIVGGETGIRVEHVH